MAASKEELKVRAGVESLFSGFHILYNWRPDFLRNKKTGKNLEYDIYIGKFHMAIEYQGAVHFKRISRYANDPDKSKYNDLLKHTLSLSNHKKDLSIVEVFEFDLVGDFKKNLIRRISNTMDANIQNGLFNNAFNLFKCIYFLKNGVIEKPEINCICDPEYVAEKKRIEVLSKMANVRKSGTRQLIKWAENTGNQAYLPYFIGNKIVA
jgi:hypothetical protein